MIIYLDTETTGLRPGKICQLSYVMQDENGTTAKNLYFSVDYVEAGALSVHGLSPQKLKVLSGGKTFQDCIEEIEKDFSKADLVVCHNVSFDFMFLTAEFENALREFCVKESFCSMKKLTPVIKLKRSSGMGYKYPKLSETCAYFKLSDMEILKSAQELFGESLGYHDARFDTTALYLAVNRGMKTERELEHLKDFI